MTAWFVAGLARHDRRRALPTRRRSASCTARITRSSASWPGSPISAARNGTWCRPRWCSSAIGLADWSRARRRAPRRAFPWCSARRPTSSPRSRCPACSSTCVKVLFGRARPRLIDEFGALSFRPVHLRLSQCQLPVRPFDHGRRDHRHTDGLVSALVAADHRARPVLRRDPDRRTGALSVRRRRRLSPRPRSSRSSWRAGWPGAACCSVRSRKNPSGGSRPAAQENRCRRDSSRAGNSAPRPVPANVACRSSGGVGPAKSFVLDQRPIMHFDAFRDRGRSARVGWGCIGSARDRWHRDMGGALHRKRCQGWS